MPGELATLTNCAGVVNGTVTEFGRIDILVNNAAFQMTHETLEEIPDEEWLKTFDVNVTAMFRICNAALPNIAASSSIIIASSVNSDAPSPSLLAYAITKGAIAHFTASLAQMLGKRGIRVNSVPPGQFGHP